MRLMRVCAKPKYQRRQMCHSVNLGTKCQEFCITRRIPYGSKFSHVDISLAFHVLIRPFSVILISGVSFSQNEILKLGNHLDDCFDDIQNATDPALREKEAKRAKLLAELKTLDQ